MGELRETDPVQEKILQGITDPLLLISKDLKVLWANNAFQNQAGYKIEEIIGNYCYKLTHHQETPCKLPYDLCPIAEAKETGKAVSTTHTHFNREGNKIFVEVSAYPVKDEEGEIVHFVYMYKDISKMKRVEEEFRNTLEESKRRETEISALLEASSALLKYPDFNSAARAIFDSCKNLIGATSGYIALLSKDGTENEVLFLDSGGLPCTVDSTLPMPIRGLRGEAYQSVKTVYDNDFAGSKWMEFMPEGHVRLDNVMFAPMVFEGKAVGLLGIANKPGDFTENDARLASAFAELAAIALTQKRAEETLKDSKERYRSLVELFPDAIAVHSEGKYVYVNPSGVKLFGVTEASEIVGKKVLDLVHPDYRKIVSERIELSYEQRIQAPIIESKIVRLDGRSVDVEVMSTPITYMGKPATQVVLHDITERKQAEQGLHYEREKLINILDSIPDGVYIVNEQYDIDYVNPFLQKIYGPVNGQKCYEYFEGQKKVCSWCKGQEVFKDNKTCRWEWYSPKTQKTYDLIDTPLINPDGSISKLEIFRDISERKTAEERLRQAKEALQKANEELESKVQERTAELSKAYETVKAERQQLYDVLDTLPAYVVLLSTDYHVPFANRFFEERFGKSNGQRCYEYLFNRTEPCEICETFSVLKTNAPHHWEWTGPDGRNYDIYDFPFKDTEGSTLIMEVGLDITKSKQAEMTIKKSEKKYRTLIEQAAEAIAIFDQQLNFIDVNSAACQMTGFTREELLKLNVKDIMPEEDFTSTPPQLAEVIAGKAVLNETRLRRKDGTLINIRVSVKMLEDGTVQTITRDITERKKIEERNRLITNLLELFVKTSSRKEYLDSVVDLLHEWTGCKCIGIRVLDKEGNIPYESYRGFSLDFWQQENWISVKNHQCACIRMVLQKPDPQDMSMMTPNGSFRCNNTEEFAGLLTEKELSRYRGLCIQTGFKSIAIVPVHYKETVLGVFHIADRREGMVPTEKIEFIESISPLVGEAILRFSAEEELLKSESRLSEAQRVAHLGNWDWNIQTNQLYWSDEIYHIFGLSPQQFGATYDAFLDSVHPEDRELVEKAVNEALYEKKPYSIDHRIVMPDGSVRIVQEQAEVMFNESGKPVRMIGIGYDITDRKRAEEKLKESYEQLRNLSEHLQSIREEERTNIAREIHDELGQALTALKIDISMIGNKLYPDHKPLVAKTESMIERIDETIQAVKKICTELRPTVLDHFGLSAAIEWQAEDFQKRTGINCEVSFHPEDIVLDQDISIVIFRIFQEALTNIMRHADATEVKASLKAKDGMITLEVKDNGKGITEEQIFNSTSFGLLGIRERVNFLGGNVTISGISNKGTAIKVNIPFKKRGRS
ncbi:MAG: PAS domain S-box protein [Nitrospirota bacterium]